MKQTREMIVKDAKKEGEEEKDKILQQAQKQSSQILENANRQAQQQHDKIMKDMHGEIVDVAISAAEKMLQDKIDTEVDKNNIDAFIKEVVSK